MRSDTVECAVDSLGDWLSVFSLGTTHALAW